jgi:hypothetical protein
MQGQQYNSPSKKAPGKTIQYTSIVDKGRKIAKLSERKARTPFPPPPLSPEEVLEEFKKKKQEQAAKKGITVRSRAPEPSFADCYGFEEASGFGDSMSMEEIEYGYNGDEEESDDEENESFENMRLDRLEDRVNGCSRTELFNQYSRQFVAGKKQSYKAKLKRFKGNWKEFIDCVTGDLAWSSVAPPTGVQPCDCKELIQLPAVSWSGTSLL